jgi:hypothetical protein
LRGKFATLCQPIPKDGPRPGNVVPTKGEGSMNPAVNRRLTVAVSWALARRATLDSLEHYEESFAITEEFREWLLCLDEHPELLEASVLMVPNDLGQGIRPESDGLLEI